MVSCADMKKGEVYACEVCGLELEVKAECNCPDIDDCNPAEGHACCEFECCGKPMAKR